MKKIVGLTISAILIIVTVGGATWAFFGDFESSTGNSLASGTLDLNIDGGDIAVTTFSVTDVEPGDSGSGLLVFCLGCHSRTASCHEGWPR